MARVIRPSDSCAFGAQRGHGRPAGAQPDGRARHAATTRTRLRSAHRTGGRSDGCRWSRIHPRRIDKAAAMTGASMATTPARRAVSTCAVPASGTRSTTASINSNVASANGAFADRLRRASVQAKSLLTHRTFVAATNSGACAVPCADNDALNSTLASRTTFNDWHRARRASWSLPATPCESGVSRAPRVQPHVAQRDAPAPGAATRH